MSDKQQLLLVGGGQGQKDLVKKYFNVQVRHWDGTDVGRTLPEVKHIYVWASASPAIEKYVANQVFKREDTIRCATVKSTDELLTQIRDDGYELRRETSGPNIGTPVLFLDRPILDNSPFKVPPAAPALLARTPAPAVAVKASSSGLTFDHIHIPDDTHASTGRLRRGLVRELLDQIVPDPKAIKSALLASHTISAELKKRYNLTVNYHTIRQTIQEMRKENGLVHHRRAIIRNGPTAKNFDRGIDQKKPAAAVAVKSFAFAALDAAVRDLCEGRAMIDRATQEIKNILHEYAGAFAEVAKLREENKDLKAKLEVVKEAMSL